MFYPTKALDEYEPGYSKAIHFWDTPLRQQFHDRIHMLLPSTQGGLINSLRTKEGPQQQTESDHSSPVRQLTAHSEIHIEY